MKRSAGSSSGRRSISGVRSAWPIRATTPLTFGRALVAALLLSRWIRRRSPDETNIGLLLPASVGGALANVATSLAGKVPVNLNFTAGREAMATAIERCGIRTILTSQAFLSKAGIERTDGMVFLEDVLPQFSAVARLRMLADGVRAARLGAQPRVPRASATQIGSRPSSSRAAAPAFRRA